MDDKNTETNLDYYGGSALIFAYYSLIWGLLAGLGVIAWQVWHWLKTAVWLPVTASDILAWLKIDTTAIYTWKWGGLTLVAEWMLTTPLSVICVVSGLVIAILAFISAILALGLIRHKYY